MTAILEVQAVSKLFASQAKGSVTALDKVSLQLYPGEVLGLVGASGSGKSTLARIITRLTEASSGKILLEGRDITKVTGRELREVYSVIQMVFQSPSASFDPRRTIGYSIAESLHNRGWKPAVIQKRVQELLQQCGLPPSLAERYPHEVSGGQCQRAAIARALAVQPRILVCDEATSALDVTVQKQIIALLQSLCREQGLACLFICHKLALVQSFCDRVLVMHAGRLVEENTPENIINDPQTAYTKSLVEAAL